MANPLTCTDHSSVEIVNAYEQHTLTGLGDYRKLLDAVDIACRPCPRRCSATNTCESQLDNPSRFSAVIPSSFSCCLLPHDDE